MPITFLPENESFEHMVQVSMVYEEIEWNWLPDNFVVVDQWADDTVPPQRADRTLEPDDDDEVDDDREAARETDAGPNLNHEKIDGGDPVAMALEQR